MGQAKMLALVVLPALLVVCNAAPGGYTGYGGLYPNMNQNADYMAHAKNAAKLASQIAFEEDESLSGAQAVRPARRASVYVPTFFTSEPQPNVADSAPCLSCRESTGRPSRLICPCTTTLTGLLTSRWSTSKTQLLDLKDSLLSSAIYFYLFSINVYLIQQKKKQ